jgi:hypothetical protein
MIVAAEDVFLIRLETSWVRVRNELHDCPLYLVGIRSKLVPALTKNTASDFNEMHFVCMKKCGNMI